jgi:acyl carrier protein
MNPGQVDARAIGFDATVVSLQELLADRFAVARDPRSIGVDEPLFSAGVGLSSLEGMELLASIEETYGVQIDDLDAWLEDTPTIGGVARYLVDHSPE